MHGERVLFLDGEALIIDKPAGLPVDPPRDGSLSLENHLESLKFGFQRWPMPVHRLDRDTSGCLLLSRNPKAHARLQQAFEQGLVSKRYLAVLDGVPAEETGTIDMPLGKISSAEEGWRMVEDAKGKAARTGWRVLATRDGRSLVEFIPQTGRTHQIRVHAALGLGAAVVGDPVYGQKDRLGMMLHAQRLVVPRPGKADVVGIAPLPERFATAGFGEEPGVEATPSPHEAPAPDPRPEPDNG
ncbi:MULTISPECIES: RluA family pseudouridine synthase [unclassified Sphingomonas]|uniref:RluA family pseudouridine synthase n=1 Tax=unclassified Sphingomonas TaxID=196159 RepID=UPI0017833B64|nr:MULTISPECIES: RNA pseudouridine synthase [unclassified Sphingomonas]MBD8640572.1 RNA pseudouridine synthase [Sphingomonas sp. CFBP 13733]MBD8700313.1 RNA pseudouridine synthase [Sphingomonas sp. CFBP 13714]